MTEQKLNPHDVALVDFNFSLHQARNFLTLEEIVDIIREVMPTDAKYLAEDILKKYE